MSFRMKQVMILLLATCFIVGVSACSGSSKNETNQPSSPSATNSTTPSQSATESATPTNDGAATKYDPPITITTVKGIDPSVTFDSGDNAENNQATRAIFRQYGIQIKHEWAVPDSNYSQKLSVTLASGSLPDFLAVNSEQFHSLVANDQVTDLTDVIEQYATPWTKAVLKKDGGIQMGTATFDGKIMGIPQMADPTNTAPVIWIRKDWLDILQLAPPKTMEDVLIIAKAFTSQDPDGNKKADTFGLAIDKDMFADNDGNLRGFFNSYHAYPNIWVPGPDGKLVYGSIQPEARVALQSLQDLFKSGAIDPEFGVKDASKMDEDIGKGKFGMTFGVAPNLFGLIAYISGQPDSQWVPYPIVSFDGQPAKASVSFGSNGLDYFVVRKGYEHPEALVLLINFFLNNEVPNSDDPENKNAEPGLLADKNKPDTTATFDKEPVFMEPFGKNIDVYKRYAYAIQSGDDSKLIGEGERAAVKTIKELMAGTKKGDVGAGVVNGIFGPAGGYSVVNQYVENGLILSNAFLGGATASMQKYQASLDAMQATVFTKIILNDAPITEFDKFVENWKSTGGDKITEEVNEWYASSK